MKNVGLIVTFEPGDYLDIIHNGDTIRMTYLKKNGKNSHQFAFKSDKKTFEIGEMPFRRRFKAVEK